MGSIRFIKNYVYNKICIYNTWCTHKLTVFAVSPGHCIKGWALSRREKKCYLFSTMSKTWEQARDYCRSYGGDLIAISNFYELEMVKGKIIVISPSLLYMCYKIILCFT